MTTKAAEKMIEAFTALMEGFSELQEEIENEYGVSTDEDDEEDEEDEERDIEADTAVVNEMRAVLEAVVDNEDFAPEEIAALITTVTDALEEIDPNVFETEVESVDSDTATASAGEDEDYGDLDDDDLYDEDEEGEDEKDDD